MIPIYYPEVRWKKTVDSDSSFDDLPFTVILPFNSMISRFHLWCSVATQPSQVATRLPSSQGGYQWVTANDSQSKHVKFWFVAGSSLALYTFFNYHGYSCDLYICIYIWLSQLFHSVKSCQVSLMYFQLGCAIVPTDPAIRWFFVNPT